MSTSKTLRCSRARKAERLMDVMVFPHPPFWFTTAIVRITHSSRRWCAFPDGPTVAKGPDDRQQFIGVSTDGTPTRGGHQWLGFAAERGEDRRGTRLKPIPLLSPI